MKGVQVAEDPGHEEVGMSGRYVYALLTSVVLCTAAATLAAPAQERPGEPTKGRIWVENRGLEEAIPVSLHDVSLQAPLTVQIAGTPTVALNPGSELQARLVRQQWEYRTVNVGKGQDLAAALTAPGGDGWEVAGVQPDQSGTTVLLKRPR